MKITFYRLEISLFSVRSLYTQNFEHLNKVDVKATVRGLTKLLDWLLLDGL